MQESVPLIVWIGIAVVIFFSLALLVVIFMQSCRREKGLAHNAEQKSVVEIPSQRNRANKDPKPISDRATEEKFQPWLDQLSKTSAMKLSDLDDRGFALLDILESKLGMEAVFARLQQELVGVTRDQITNGRLYLWALLRKLDEQAYTEFKNGATDKPLRRRSSGGAPGRKQEKKQQKVSIGPSRMNGDAPEFVPVSPPPVPGKVALLSTKAVPFVPGQSYGLNGGFRINADEFVPGMVGHGWIKGDVKSGAESVEDLLDLLADPETKNASGKTASTP